MCFKYDIKNQKKSSVITVITQENIIIYHLLKIQKQFKDSKTIQYLKLTTHSLTLFIEKN